MRRIKGNGVSSTNTYELASFENLRLEGPMEAHLVEGTDHKVTVTTDENLQDYIERRIEGNTLVLSVRDHVNLKPRKGLRVEVTAPKFVSMQVRGTGDIITDGLLHSDRFDIQISGAGDIRMDLDAPMVHSKIAGAGSIELGGRTQNFDAEIRGAGDIKAYDLLSEHCKVRIAGTGDAQVFASKTLSIEIAGTGDVSYRGTASVQQKINGAGDVRKAD